MKLTTIKLGLNRVWIGLLGVVLISGLSQSGCQKPNPQTPATPTTSGSQPAAETNATGGSTTGAESGAGAGNKVKGSRDENSRPLNPEKFGKR